MAIAPITLADLSPGSTAGFYVSDQNDLDYNGMSVAAAGDINGDGYEDIIIGVPGGNGENQLFADAGYAYVILGGPEKMSGQKFAGPLGPVFSGTLGIDTAGNGGFGLGWDVASAGDFNGDGFDDVIVSFPKLGGFGFPVAAGVSYLFFGSSDPVNLTSVDFADSSGAYVTIVGQSGDSSGYSVAGAGDINGDGFDDIIVGGTSLSPSLGGGRTYVVFGHSGTMPASIDLSTIAAGSGGFVIRGRDGGDASGTTVASPGDINGDGIADILISAPGGDGDGNAQPSAGEAYVVFGKTEGFGTGIDLSTVAAGTGGFVIYAEDGAYRTASTVSGAGDVNNDGFADIIIGAYDLGAGAQGISDAYVVFGQAGGFSSGIDLSEIAGGNGGFKLRDSNIPEEWAGTPFSLPAVGALGDVNGDGIDDFSFSGFQNYVIFGRADGFEAPVDLDAIAAGTGGFLVPPSSNLGFFKGAGGSPFLANGGVLGAGDINGDGYDDIVVGNPYGADYDGGEVYVLYGRDFTGTVTHAGTAGNNGLIGTAGADDMVGGQGNDTLIGAGGADVLIGGSGNDVLEVGDLKFVRVDGGTGSDTLRINQIVALDLRAIPDTRIKDIEVITLRSPGASLILTQREVLNISSTSNTLTVNGASGTATTNLIRFDYWNWTKTGPSGGYDVYTNGGATLRVDPLIAIAGIGTGTDGDDTIDAGARNDALSGLAGNDTLNGGAGNDSLDGGSGNDTLVGGPGNDSMKGGAGDDTYSVDATGDTVVENLNEGTDTVNTSRNSYTLGSNVENLTFVGTGAFTGTGNALMNRIVGGTGNDTLGGGDGDDTLDGGTGADSMSGGAGSDVYFVDDAGDTVIENLNEGDDTVNTSLNSYTLDANVENLTFVGSGAFTGTGNALVNRIVGGTGNDTLGGGDGDDTLDGGTGADSMSGGAGSDVYFVDDAGDTVIEDLDEGNDTVKTSLNSDTLSVNVENLTFVGSGAFTGIGNALGNRIIGGAGDDTLDGGTGADSMIGGAGSDVYVVDDAVDAVIENPDEGIDTVDTSLNSHTLAANVENLTFVGTGAFTGTGNALMNRIIGGTGDDTLDGGTGADSMIGGAGNDVYFIDDAGDAVIENLDEGTDTVNTWLNSYTLGDGIEKLTFVGTGAFAGTGNSLANTIAGSTGSDRLDGRVGADVMSGGTGNDTYFVDAAGDRVVEAIDEGADKVYAKVDFTLMAGQEIEFLRAYAGTTGLTLTGNELRNTIEGGAGDDKLYGGRGGDKLLGSGGDDRLDGGSRADIMTGGTGNDTYFVDDASDHVIEVVGEGSDKVYARADYALAAGQEVEWLRAYAGTTGLTLTGNELRNTVEGSAGDDTLYGGRGGDKLRGGDGADTLDGGAGNDTLEGQGGADVFLFGTKFAGVANVDTIVDFDIAQDVIYLDQTFFAGLALGLLSASAFANDSPGGTAPQIVYDRPTGSLSYDSNGADAGGASSFAKVTGAPALTANSFVIV